MCKKFLALVMFFSVLLSGASAWAVEINAENFPDDNFRAYLINKGITSVETVTVLDVSGRNISSLEGIEYFTSLTKLICSDNSLGSLDLSRNTELKVLYCSNNELTYLDLSQNTKLEELTCYDNKLPMLDLSNNKSLTGYKNFSGQDIVLQEVDRTGNAEYPYSLNLNNYSDYLGDVSDFINRVSNIKVEDYHGADMARYIDINASEGTVYFYAKPKKITYSYNTHYENLVMEKISVTVSDPEPPEEDVEISTENFPDTAFREYVKNLAQGSNVLSRVQLRSITNISVSNKNIYSLKGIEYFTYLETLNCSNNKLTSLDLGSNTRLTTLNCSYNNLTSLNVSKNTALTYLSCSNNALTALNVASNTKLASLYCNNNDLTALNVSRNTLLKLLYCNDNAIKKLDLSMNTELTDIVCYKNELIALNLEKNIKRSYVRVESQSANITGRHENGKYTINLKEYDASVNLDNITNIKAQGVPLPESEYSKDTSSIHFSSEQTGIEYDYNTGASIAMQVSVNIVYTTPAPPNTKRN